MRVEIEDTYAEAFRGLYSRVMVTADDEDVLSKAVEDATATPSIVIGRIEGGIERWLSGEETPDGRQGAIIQFWAGIEKGRPLSDWVKRLEVEMSYRIRQDILVKPFTAVYDALPNPEGEIDTLERIGHCGDGFEWEEERYGRKMIIVPLMVPDFQIERYLGYGFGVMGGNFWYMCHTKQAVMEAGRRALRAIKEIEGVITPFGVCSAGSKPETKFSWIGPTTNHPYCPSLRRRLGEESKVPEGVGYIPEIVINGVSLAAVKQAMKVGVEAARHVEGVMRISAGNYGGELGEYQIHLAELSS
ncbi:formylmethanofuran--tetrahydromethanopterin N-formyltransferase [Candidatus Bathyarchaeota archaeon]|nr:formylmethanofuran--tetrahydromethanopterin N-formyltransferase [Candidatus Bathyarchaeota archaeon]NIU81507.1 formylmethanofuran--tetrahydromethanopterin N-formyltransferase [Candidatus Bathyarchaeota archaeon]NIV68142.1 formylmethanofuran--tetrahydromethanopterin N-formyltransferase [Candidatus Bathyarchaeota archaeon]NIW16204.1 formylmethanofuran--tetrahydromethanopterin N-formyltransferase [Candidatus Bathyarchaeota archaeon]NIW34657.1 formylmethanofuran--tetrahydromethanopterin N-formyl